MNNAGINPESALGTPGDIDLNAFDDTVDVNLRGTFARTSAASEHLEESDHGVVVNVASVGGVVGLPGRVNLGMIPSDGVGL